MSSMTLTVSSEQIQDNAKRNIYLHQSLNVTLSVAMTM